MSSSRRAFRGRRNPGPRPALRSAPVTRGRIQTSHLGLSATRMNGPVDPRQVRSNITVSQYRQITVAASTGSLTEVTVAMLAAGLSGSVRFERFSIFGAGQSSTLDMDGSIFVVDFVSKITFEDKGSAGSRRPVVHYQAPLQTRQTWHPVADTSVILDLGDVSSFPVLIQYYAEFLNTA